MAKGPGLMAFAVIPRWRVSARAALFCLPSRPSARENQRRCKPAKLALEKSGEGDRGAIPQGSVR